MMELDELKNTWQRYDQKLEENLKLNEQLFRSLKLDNSRRAMNYPLKYDIINCLTLILLFLATIYYLQRFCLDTTLLFSCLSTLVFCIVNLTLCIKRIRMLSNIDFYNSTVFDLQKKLSDFKRVYHKFKKIELSTSPLVIGLAILTPKIIYNMDITKFPVILGLGIILGLGLGVILACWLYKNVYEKQIEATNHFLKELEEFQKE